MTSRIRSLRELIETGRLIIAPGCYDVLSAKIIESLGFNAVYLGGYACGASMGTTEPLTTLTEMLMHSQYIANRLDIPLIVDGNAGFGDATHTWRTVREFERAGVAAIHIEDQVIPKRAHYHIGKKYVIPMEEMLGKIEAALQARKSHEFMIIARTDTRDADNGGGVQDVICRCNAYAEAGADMVMPYSTTIPSIGEAKKVVQSISAPVLLVNSEGKTGYPQPTAREYEEIGCKVVVYNISSIIVAARAVAEVYSNLKSKGVTGLDMEYMAGWRTKVEELIGLPSLYAIEKKTKKD